MRRAHDDGQTTGTTTRDGGGAVGLEAWALALAGSPWIVLVVFLLAAIDGFFPPVPAESVVIALATLASVEGVPNLWLVVPAAALGAFTGDQVAYQIGARVRVRELRLFRGRRGAAALDWAERALEERGAAFIIAARYVPIGRVAVNMTAGALRYDRKRFTGLAAIAAVTWALYAAAIGMGTAAWLGDSTWLAVAVGVVGGVSLGIVLDWALRRWVRPRRSAGSRSEAQDLDARREPVGASSSRS